jgi:hypothetical protein
MLFQKSLVGNSRSAAQQWDEVKFSRNACNLQEQIHEATMRQAGRRQGGIVANAGLIPKDVYQEFDNVTVERFRSDDGDVFLNDLLALSRSVRIGKLVSKFRQASTSGVVKTSMSGQIGAILDQVDFTYDGCIIPVMEAGFGRNWREFDAQSSEGFDALIDDQRESVAAVRKAAATQFLDGHKDQSGQFIKEDGISWEGMRTDSRVASVNLGAGGINFDFTATANTGEQIKAAFITIRDVQWIDNKVSKESTFYVSKEIAANLERRFSAQYDSKTINQELAELMNVKEIKVTSLLSGNELMGFPLDRELIQPVVGMAVNTVAMPRQTYNANYNFATWAAIGFQIRTDFYGNTPAIFASDLG